MFRATLIQGDRRTRKLDSKDCDHASIVARPWHVVDFFDSIDSSRTSASLCWTPAARRRPLMRFSLGLIGRNDGPRGDCQRHREEHRYHSKVTDIPRSSDRGRQPQKRQRYQPGARANNRTTFMLYLGKMKRVIAMAPKPIT
jgi:hypothetical protein